MNHAQIKPSYACHRHHLHWLGAHHLKKASCKISVRSLIDFWAKAGKVQRHIHFCTLMVPYLYAKTIKTNRRSLRYWVSPQKCPDFIILHLQKYWIWFLQTFHSNSAWHEIEYWFLRNHLHPWKFCMNLEVSKF